MSPQAVTSPTVTLHHARPALVVHAALRRELRLAGPLVRRVPDGDVRRAAVVGRHLDFVLRMLHHHHESEDVSVWPRLRERAGAAVLPLVEQMDREHARIVELSQRSEALLEAWTATGAAATGDDLATALDDLLTALAAHLDVEERDLLGIAEQHLTAEEWEAMGTEAQAAFPGKERALVFGMLAYQADPAIIAFMLATAPAPVRVLVPRLARRAYRRHARSVHGTSTP